MTSNYVFRNSNLIFPIVLLSKWPYKLKYHIFMIIIILIIFIEYLGFATIGLLPKLCPVNPFCNHLRNWYQIEPRNIPVGDLQKTEDIFSICLSILTNLGTAKFTIEKWEQHRTNVEFYFLLKKAYVSPEVLYIVCNSGYRCHICQTFASSLNNYMVKSRNLASRHGRPLEPALGFVRPKQVLDETVGKTWLKLVKIGQNWTKPNNFRIC